MTTKIGIRELSRNSNILNNYDYIEVEDKKTHEFKGLFISAKYAQEFKSFLENKLKLEQEEKLNRIMKYAGKGKIDKNFENLTSSEIKAKKDNEKYNEN